MSHSSKFTEFAGIAAAGSNCWVKSRQTKKAEFQAINAIKYLQEIVQLEFGAF